MSDDTLTLAGDFPAPTRDEWRAAVEKALKGAPFDKKMLTKTYEGITLQPLYTLDDWKPENDPSGLPGFKPYTRGGQVAGQRVGGWDLRQLHTHPDPQAVNKGILTDLERGATSVTLRLDDAARGGDDADQAANYAGLNGLMAYTAADFDTALTGVYEDLAAVALESGAAFLPAAALLAGHWKTKGVDASKVKGAFNADPLNRLAATGSLPGGVEAGLKAMADLAAYTSKTFPHVTAVRVDTGPYHLAGATETQDLAIAMATAVAYLRAMTDAGLSIDDAARQITFQLPVGADQFMGIAKLRAARRLWGRVMDACGASDEAGRMRLTAATAERIVSQRDPWVNMLRTTVTTFAAAVGGAETNTVLPFDAMLGLPTEFARRIARNTQLILMEESNLDKVIDPAGGSWYVETLTEEVAAEAWTLFQDIEKHGGMAACLESGHVLAKIEAAHTARAKNIAKRKDPITGVSEFPNIHEKPVDIEKPDLDALRRAAAAKIKEGRATVSLPLDKIGSGSVTEAAIEAAAKGATIGALSAALFGAGETDTVTALPRRRLAAEFEDLRDASDEFMVHTGARPKVFLANLGPIAAHTARATFAKNFFEAGGIEAVTNPGFDSAEACAEGWKQSGAPIAILCSSDAVYDEMAEQTAQALKAAGAKRVYLAGAPGEKKDAYTAAGIDGFVYMGCDALDTLRGALALMGVIDR
ncbi:methylmalonyl-CoA mutase family protein [Caenispirillum salinarum]|uniref:methylmalonyl-CoA mutase family protein n=1 Tax=Caenispirillum salinarum TaxID=859058 RepID=UPI00384E9D74